MSACTLARLVAERLRTVASSSAVSGMMLSFVPPAIRPTVTTTGSKTSKPRVTIACSATTISQATGMGSFARCGEEP